VWSFAPEAVVSGSIPITECEFRATKISWINGSFIFVAPELILHYIDAHAYQPPMEFSQAVLACPPVPSTAYLEGVSANGGGVLLAAGT
jgi:hypothetical protein